MKQQRLPSAKPTMARKQAAQQSSNVVLARIILAEKQRYAGLQVEWAERILAKAEQSR